MLRIVSVVPLHAHNVRVDLTDGSVRVLNLLPMLRGPQHRPLLDDMTLFRRVGVVHGTLSWPSGQDLDPDVLLGAQIAGPVTFPQPGARVALGGFKDVLAFVEPNEHSCPHVLLVLGSEQARVRITDGEVLEGVLSAPSLKAFQTWLAANRSEVALKWVLTAA